MSVIVMEGSHGAGKSTMIKNMEERYDLVSLKSIPDWFRKYLSFARSLPPDIQKQVYLIGHDANYVTFQDDKDYILDRYYYTTIIRLNYELQKDPDYTVKEILDINIKPDIVFYLKIDKDTLISRLTDRGDCYLFDSDFFDYENEIYGQLCQKSDRIILVNNQDNVDVTINEIDRHLQKQKVLLRRR